MGDLGLMRVDRALPPMVSRAERHGTPLVVTLLRPGPPRLREGVASTPGDLADLATAVSLQLGDSQSLYEATGGRLAVVSRSATGHRVASLVRRARAGGAPTCTWVTVRFPRDARSSKALLELATRRLDGRSGEGDAHGVARLRRRGAVAAAAAAVLAVVALVFALGGPEPGKLAAVPLRSPVSATTDASATATSTVGGNASPGAGTGVGTSDPSSPGRQAVGLGSSASSSGPAPAPGSGSASGGTSAGGASGGSGQSASDPGQASGSSSQSRGTAGSGSSPTTVAATTTTVAAASSTTTTTSSVPGVGSLVSNLLNGLRDLLGTEH